MTEGAEPRGGGTRDNGLRCASYVPVADLDPRVVGALLDELRDNGIAAYAVPTPAASIGYLDSRLPERPVDRLFVDETMRDRAKALVDAETTQNRDTASLDFEAAWKQVLTSLQSPDSAAGSPLVPGDAAPSEAATTSYVVRPATLDDEEPYDVADEAHYEPPPPPPLPKLRRATVAALVSIAFGMFLLAANVDGGSFVVVAILAIAGGVASLVWHMRQGPPTDSGWDDGAVV